MDPEYWHRKSLDSLTPDEWEALCDGCGKCCLHKLEDPDTGEVQFTNVACCLLDPATTRCRDYDNRSRRVPDCVPLSADTVQSLHWLPATCAYRLRSEDKDLPWWHPLVSGDPESVVRSGNSVGGRTIDESVADDLAHHLISWVR